MGRPIDRDQAPSTKKRGGSGDSHLCSPSWVLFGLIVALVLLRFAAIQTSDNDRYRSAISFSIRSLLLFFNVLLPVQHPRPKAFSAYRPHKRKCKRFASRFAFVRYSLPSTRVQLSNRQHTNRSDTMPCTNLGKAERKFS